jgi:hypothetical protein
MGLNESGAADEQLDGTCRRPRASRGLGHATDVVQQPTKCAVSMNFIVLNERGAASGFFDLSHVLDGLLR